jgi:prepilin-type N-terminal cleavage/methylation domain-containing protein
LVTRRRQRGYSLLEVVVAMTIFGIVLAILFQLTAEMRYWEKRLPVNMYKHPQIIAVLARLRRDVQDSLRYENAFDGYTSSEQVLIVETVNTKGGVDKVIWDFRTPREVHRREYSAGKFEGEWVARGVPAAFTVAALKTRESAAWAARITAKDTKGRLAIDTILQPRAEE